MVKIKKKKPKDPIEKQGLTPEQIEIMINEKVSKLDHLPEDQRNEQAKVLKKIFTNGMSPRLAMGLPADFGTILYTYAYNLFQGGKYGEAGGIFRMLALLEPTVPLYHLALAATYQRLKEYKKAIECYFVTAVLDEENPLPFFHISHCYEQLDNNTGAVMGLGGAITRCGDEPKYAAIKNKCLIMLNKWRKSVGMPEESEKAAEQGTGNALPEVDDLFGQLQDTARKEGEKQ